MREVGKALVFYLTYWPEMERVYEEEDHDLLGLRDSQARSEAIEKVTDVAVAAGRDAAYLIDECAADLRNRIASAKAAKWKPSREATVQTNWHLEVELSAYRSRKRGVRSSTRFGMVFERSGITPYVWSRGGRAIEERIIAALGKEAACRRSTEVGWDGGVVAFETIPVPWKDANQFVLSADPVIATARRVLAPVTASFIEKFVVGEL